MQLGSDMTEFWPMKYKHICGEILPISLLKGYGHVPPLFNPRSGNTDDV